MTVTDPTALEANELARACALASAQPDQPAQTDLWHEFVRRFQRPIALAVFRTARTWGNPTTSLVDDLVQETFLRLCANNRRLLRAFNPREPDSILSFVAVIAANITRDHFRAQHAQRRGGPLSQFHVDIASLDHVPPTTPDQPDPLQNLQLEEIDRTLRSFVPDTLTDRDCAIFWLYFQQGFAAREIAAIPTFGLTTKGVESSIHRSTRQLREALKPSPKGFSDPNTLLEENG